MILYGASGHAKVIIDILEALGTPSDFFSGRQSFYFFTFGV